MRFSVRHKTAYHYSVPVQLAPHVLRLSPREEAARVLSRTLNIQPRPLSQREEQDAYANSITQLAFTGSTQTLLIDSQLQVETFVPPIISPLMAALPWRTDLEDGLTGYRYEPSPNADVRRFALELATQVGHAPLSFLDALTNTLCARTAQEVRPEGLAQPAAATLASGRGACRDLAVLFISACRCLGIPSRFTSGYLAPIDGRDSLRQLHAWPEVFLPGAAWRGWDPSQDQRVVDAHLPLCSAPSQTGTMPVEGGYFFTGALINTTLDFDLKIEVAR